MSDLVSIVVIGVATTAIFDVYLWAISRAGLPGANWTMGGRWFAHMARGQFTHPAIADAASIQGETAVGWTMHYLIGIAFAAATVAIGGAGWLASPTIGPALFVGVSTVLLGWFIMAPSMGAGIAAAKRPNKWTVRAVNLSGHIVFGIGLWVTASILAALG